MVVWGDTEGRVVEIRGRVVEIRRRVEVRELHFDHDQNVVL